MEKLDIHKGIYDKLNHFIEIQKIPNILFHGKYGCGKKMIINDFINKLYNNNYSKDLVMFVNCSHGKGIKFIRDDLKFFAKTNVQNNENNVNFKTIVLSNADKLTMDAQSALRRCIELFSHNTRFFVIAEDKYKLMKPILSRFCELYVPEPIYKGEIIVLNNFLLDKTFKTSGLNQKRTAWLKKEIQKLFYIFDKDKDKDKDKDTYKDKDTDKDKDTEIDKDKETDKDKDKETDKDKDKLTLNLLTNKSVFFYEKGYNSLDMINLLKNMEQLSNNIVEIYLCHNKMRKEIRNEKLLILMLLNCVFLNNLDINIYIENLSFL